MTTGPTRVMILVMTLALSLPASADVTAGEGYAEERVEMIREVRQYAKLSPPPRHEFVPEGQVAQAYTNRPLPIGHGQTISQPYIVALMTHLAQVGPEDVVLEVGTGSGYQAAVLAKLVDEVYSIEIIEPLAEQAAARLDRLGYDNVTTKLGDGYYGWPEHAPFDAIVVTAAASHVPPPLVEQLKPGGRMVIPVGSSFLTQYLLLVEKTVDDEILTRQVTAVRFVPLTGER